jgi:protocatechuate 3,4-dioxygenase beta subunit
MFLLARPLAAAAGGCTTRTPAVAGTSQPNGRIEGACVVRPEQTEGPYFVDEMLDRSDIRSDPSDQTVRPGAQVDLTFNVSRIAGQACEPLAEALVDVWHCDHLGVYSDVFDPSFDTRGKKFLRGYQTTDANGVARFTTIYPGWYSGRTVHIHFKVRVATSPTTGFEFTSQLYFDDAFTDQVYTQAPYSTRGARTVRNSGDGIYGQGGSQLLLGVTQGAAGYEAAFDLALDLGVAVEPQQWGRVKRRYRPR